MSDGKWSGSTNNRTWVRPGSRLRDIRGDADRSARLAEQLADDEFLDETCGRTHPLREHRECRKTT